MFVAAKDFYGVCEVFIRFFELVKFRSNEAPVKQIDSRLIFFQYSLLEVLTCFLILTHFKVALSCESVVL